MAVVLLVPADLTPFAPDIPEAKALAMIDDAMALAARVAPCINNADFQHEAAARAIIRAAVLRWHEAGSGVVQTEAVDDYRYTQDTRQQRKGMFWPSEITQLQELCRESGSGRAFSIDQVQPTPSDSLASRPDLWFQYVFPVPPTAP